MAMPTVCVSKCLQMKIGARKVPDLCLEQCSRTVMFKTPLAAKAAQLCLGLACEGRLASVLA